MINKQLFLKSQEMFKNNFAHFFKGYERSLRKSDLYNVAKKKIDSKSKYFENERIKEKNEIFEIDKEIN